MGRNRGGGLDPGVKIWKGFRPDPSGLGTMESGELGELAPAKEIGQDIVLGGNVLDSNVDGVTLHY